MADLGVNWLIGKERWKAERQDRRQKRGREKLVREEIEGPVQRLEPKVEGVEEIVSDEAKAEARRRLEEALRRARVG